MIGVGKKGQCLSGERQATHYLLFPPDRILAKVVGCTLGLIPRNSVRHFLALPIHVRLSFVFPINIVYLIEADSNPPPC